jgi:hypothetical protein
MSRTSRRECGERMIGVGVLTALLLWIYDRTLMPKEATAKISQAAKSNAQKACQLPIFALEVRRSYKVPSLCSGVRKKCV